MVDIPQVQNHGVRRVIDDSGPRPVPVLDASVIGIVGTAPEADAADFPLDAPVLIAGREEDFATIGATGTLPIALDLIFANCPCRIVVVRVAEGADAAETTTDVIGGVEADGTRTGLAALVNAEPLLGVRPRILIAPEFSADQAVANELAIMAERLHGWAWIDAPHATYAAAVQYAALFDDRRLANPVWPRMIVRAADGSEVAAWSSPIAAALMAATHKAKGFWSSCSNRVVKGVLRTEHPVPFENGDPDCLANHLNANGVNTWIARKGVRLWGDDTTSTDPRWRFLSVVVTDDMLADSLQEAYFRLVDANVNATFFEDLVQIGEFFFADMQAAGGTLGYRIWADGDLNSPTNLALGKAFVNYDHRPPVPARDIVMVSRVNDDYFASLFQPGS